MSHLLRENFGYLCHLTDCSPYQRKLLLTTATPEQVHAICEVCSNLSRGLIPIKDAHKERLREHVDDIRGLANPAVPFKTKKQILAQRGEGFVSDVMSPLMSTLSLFLL